MRLEASDLGCVRGGREVFAGVQFAVAGGEALVVTGRNGAGKSSLLRMIAGLLRVAAGRLALSGGAPDVLLAEQVHYLAHQDALKPGEEVLVVDDLLATGGTVRAALDLLKKLQVKVTAAAFFVELNSLKGRETLKPLPVFSVVSF